MLGMQDGCYSLNESMGQWGRDGYLDSCSTCKDQNCKGLGGDRRVMRSIPGERMVMSWKTSSGFGNCFNS